MREPPAFEAFVWEASAGLYRYAYWLAGDAGRAEDLVQQALVALWSKWESVDQDHRTPYAKAVISRRNASWWRRGSSRERPEEVIDSHDYEPHNDADDAATLAAALSKLPPRQRAVVLLRHVEDMSEQEVARALGCSVGTVKSQNAKALQKLRLSEPLREAYPGRTPRRTA